MRIMGFAVGVILNSKALPGKGRINPLTRRASHGLARKRLWAAACLSPERTTVAMALKNAKVPW